MAQRDDNLIYLNIILGNLADKVARYGLYVDRVEKEAEWERIEPDILKGFRAIYTELCGAVGDLYSLKFEHEDKIEDEKFIFRCLKRSSQIWEKFMAANSWLGYAPTPWARPELFALAKEFQKDAWNNNPEFPNLTIVLTNEYKYLWFGPPKRDAIRFVALPKIEKDDPLLWVLLSHEIGHELDERYRISDATLKAYPDATKGMKNPNFMNDWIGEIFSDLYGLNLLGPSYYAAFLSHVLAAFPMDSQWKIRRGAHYCQPPIAIRTRCMEIALQLAEPTGWDLDILHNFVGTHESVLGQNRDSSIQEFSAEMGLERSGNNEDVIEDICKPLVEAIFSAAEKNTPLSIGGNRDEVSRCAHRLEDEIPACAVPAHEFDSLEERSCDIATIVDAAWRCKAGDHPRKYSSFFHSDYILNPGTRDWSEAFSKSRQHLHNFDRLVLASLGIASVHRFYEQYLPSDATDQKGVGAP